MLTSSPLDASEPTFDNQIVNHAIEPSIHTDAIQLASATQ